MASISSSVRSTNRIRGPRIIVDSPFCAPDDDNGRARCKGERVSAEEKTATRPSNESGEVPVCSTSGPLPVVNVPETVASPGGIRGPASPTSPKVSSPKEAAKLLRAQAKLLGTATLGVQRAKKDRRKSQHSTTLSGTLSRSGRRLLNPHHGRTTLSGNYDHAFPSGDGVDEQTRAKYFGQEARAKFLSLVRLVTKERFNYTKEERDRWFEAHFTSEEGGLDVSPTNARTHGPHLVPHTGNAGPIAAQPQRIEPPGHSQSSVHKVIKTKKGREGFKLLFDQIILGEQDSVSLASEAFDSARSLYVYASLELDMIPLSGAVVRLEDGDAINLSHEGLGDEAMTIIMKSLVKLPAITKMDISDNRLTDASLKGVLRALKDMPKLKSLNLGYNNIGKAASAELRRCLSHGHTTITDLNLARADIDDVECAEFMSILQTNHVLTSLDLSGNLIGCMEAKNILTPNFLTGGEAIATQLSSPSCALQRLNLSWNGLRLGSAVAIGEALAFNKSLIELDLQYNAVGFEGGRAIGAALMVNKTLKRLNLRNNALTPKTVYILAMALRHNDTLEYLDMSGNQLGQAGARQLLGLVLDLAGRMHFVFEGCDMDSVDSSMWFNSEAPGGTHKLDLSNEYERAVLTELLGLVSRKEGVTFKSFIFNPYGDAEFGRDIRLKRVVQVVEDFPRPPLTDQEILSEFFRATGVSARGRIRAHQVQLALDRLQLGFWPVDDVNNLIYYYDRGFSGTITIEEYKQLCHFVYGLQLDGTRKRQFIAEEGTSDAWQVPLTGCLTATVEYRPQVPMTGCHTSMESIECFVKALDNVSDIFLALRLAKDFMQLQLSEASALYESLCKQTGDKAASMAAVLQRVYNTQTAHLLLEKHLKGFGSHKKQLFMVMGQAYYPVFGAYSRRYQLDLSKPPDRFTAERLYETNNMERLLRAERRPLKPDTSSRGEGYNFCNALLNGEPTSIDHSFFIRLPKHGRLQFDYIQQLRPAEEASRPMTDQRFLQCLCQIRLLAPWEVSAHQVQLQEENREKDLFDYYMHTVPTATRVGVHLSKLHGDPFPDHDDDKTRKVEALNMLYEEGVRKLAFGKDQKRKGGLRASFSDGSTRRKVEVVGPLANLRHWAKRARLRVHHWEIMHEITCMVSSRLLSIGQAVMLVKCYPQHLMDQLLAAHTSLCLEALPGRLRLAIMVYPCLADLFELDKLLFLFSAEEQAEFIFRVGRLNVFNTLRCDGGIQLALERREERHACKMFVHLKIDEPGNNIFQETWRYSRLDPCIPGWQFTENWRNEKGFGARGFITFDFYSGEGKGLQGCLPNFTLRCGLALFTNIDPPLQLVHRLVPETRGLSRHDTDAWLISYVRSNLHHHNLTFTYVWDTVMGPPSVV